ncbi:chemotaxis protein CheA [Azospirillum sp. SYSU D00513]|uniref:chemotaxis protein CheA n=1 Tax=Azospirillum sp. SYSU D00513 TaxID=2812561 RepID=UPI001A95DE16|nr:chemotaxis protein CheA [Azospirillum sp. SYSU D00513]
MNPLFEQFIIESRELLEAAGSALLRLEREPAEPGAVNDLFRALHTLKGATGLFDMPAFTRLVHAGEDALMAVRNGRLALTPDLADVLFRLLDQCAHWVDRLEAEEVMPEGADADSRRLEEALRTHLGEGGASGEATALDETFAWAGQLTGAERQALAAGLRPGVALTAVAYDPAPDCFFTGDDPLDFCRRIPDLLVLRIEPVGPWPDLASFDPYACALRFRALSAAPKSTVEAVFRTVPDQVRIASLPQEALPASLRAKPASPAPRAQGQTMAPASADPAALVPAILREQVRILSLGGSADEIATRRASVARVAGNILAALGRAGEHAALEAALAESEAAGDSGPLARHIAGLAEGVSAGASAPLRPAEAGPDGGAEAGTGSEGRAGRRALRVDPERMDRMMALVGEMVVAKSRLPHLARLAGETRGDGLAQGIREAYARIDGITGELQDAVLRLRMLPVSRVFDPLPRLVRELSRRLGKPVDLTLSGGETEADKDILDVLNEPLLHLVRNSLDHGIEPPERRQAAGKPETGTIRLAAFQDRDGVVIEIADDGAGIDADAVRRKAVDQRLIEPDRAAGLSDEQALQLIFLPGLSTSAQVSELSGRGVGMDAVRASVEQAGGRVEIASTPGQGTSIRLVLPLTMMITRVLVVETAGEPFGFPVTQVRAMRRVPLEEIRSLKHAESFVHEDSVLPLYRLRRLLNLPGDEGAGHRAESVLVAELGGQRVGLVVDGFRERTDVVLKPLTGVLSRLRGFAGTAVLGDGRLLLVVNLRELL